MKPAPPSRECENDKKTYQRSFLFDWTIGTSAFSNLTGQNRKLKGNHKQPRHFMSDPRHSTWEFPPFRCTPFTNGRSRRFDGPLIGDLLMSGGPVSRFPGNLHLTGLAINHDNLLNDIVHFIHTKSYQLNSQTGVKRTVSHAVSEIEFFVFGFFRGAFSKIFN